MHTVCPGKPEHGLASSLRRPLQRRYGDELAHNDQQETLPMAALAIPLAKVADALLGRPVFLADGENFGVVDQVVRVGDEDTSRDCLVVIPTDARPEDTEALIIPEDAVSAVNEDYEVILRTTRPWVGHYCLAPRCDAPPRARPNGRDNRSVWSSIRARVPRSSRR